MMNTAFTFTETQRMVKGYTPVTATAAEALQECQHQHGVIQWLGKLCTSVRQVC